MTTQYISDVASLSQGSVISADHFGANMVATANFATEGGPYDAATSAMGISSIRYPGGTVTEERIEPGSDTWNGILDPLNNTFVEVDGGERIQTLTGVVEYAESAGVNVNFVMPTQHFLIGDEVGGRSVDIDAIQQAVDDLAEFMRSVDQAAYIRTIEIGNEYYYNDRMTASEYADLVNEIVPRLSEAMNSLEGELYGATGFRAPDIAVQSGAGWRPGDNATILNGLDEDVLSEIDMVVLHYYPQTLSGVGNFDRHFSQAEEWLDHSGTDGIRFYVSEWNVQNTSAADFGFMHANTMVHAFEELLVHNVDMASIWGTQYRSMDTRLSTLSSRDGGDEASQNIDTNLTAAGEMFLAMSHSLIGLRSLDVDVSNFIEAGDEVADAFASFGDANRFVAFGANRDFTEEAHLQLDLRQYFGDEGHVAIRVYRPVDDPATLRINEADGGSPHAIPDMDYFYTGDMPADSLSITLPPGSLVVIEVQIDGNGVWLEGQNPVSDRPFVGYDDVLNGSAGDDTIFGHTGDDKIFGGNGDDIAFGGNGNDTLYGGAGNDLLHSGVGSNVAEGGNGDDSIILSGASNVAHGGEGDDLFLVGGGQNDIAGGEGDDIFWLAGGQNSIAGGAGANLYIIGGGSATTITDFSAENGDRIDLSLLVGSREELGDVSVSIEEGSGEDGSSTITLQLNDTTSVSIENSFLTSDQILASIDVGDFGFASGDAVAGAVNGLNFDQVAALTEGMPSEIMDVLLDSENPSDFLDGLRSDLVPALARGMDPEEISEMVSYVGEDRLLDGLNRLSPDDAMSLICDSDASQVSAFFSGISSDAANSWFHSLDSQYSDLFETFLLRAGVEIDPQEEGPKPTTPDTPDEPTVPVIPGEDDNPDTPEEDDQTEEVAGDCYIATVVYRNPEHPEVCMLRWYRDNVLRHSVWGRMFVGLYWIVGPILARTACGSALLRVAAFAIIRSLLLLISLGYRRAIGPQVDHIPWAENRQMRFKLRNARKGR